MLSSLVVVADILIAVGLWLGLIVQSLIYGPTELGPDNFDGVINYDVADLDKDLAPAFLSAPTT